MVRIYLGIVLLFFVSCKPVAHSSGKAAGSDLRAADGRGYSAEALYKAGNRQGTQIRDHYLDKVQPILSARCAACHNCSDAPCQLKMTSWKMIMRGASKDLVYDRKRIKEVLSTREFDARSPLEWHSKRNFFPVVSYDARSPQNNSVLGQLIDHGKQNQPGFSLDSLSNMRDNRLGYKFTCPEKQDELSAWLAAHPGAGMPLGLPALSDSEYATLTAWLSAGAPGPEADAHQELYTPQNPSVIEQWERFLNGPTAKERHMSRYIYEHSYQAHIHLAEVPGEFYRIVRSHDRTGLPISEVVTELPNDGPGRAFFYRLKKVDEVIGKKSHFVWNLSNGSIESFRKTFLSKPWPAESAGGVPEPKYESRNPFEYFEPIPAEARWQFLRKNAKLIVDAFLQTEVCVGSVPLFVVMDQFWLWFLEGPDDPSVVHPKLGLDDWDNHWSMESQGVLANLADRLRADFESISQAQLPLPGTARYKRDTIYRRAFEDTLRQMHPSGLKASHIWNGGGDRNAFITVLRHGSNGAAVYGAVGAPQSVIVFSYSLFERMYYDLVLNFRYWGSTVHKMTTWNFMNGLRIEGEDLFLSFLPEDQRVELRGIWSRGLMSLAQKSYHPMLSEGRPTQVRRLGSMPQTVAAFVKEVTSGMAPDVVDPNGDFKSFATAANTNQPIQSVAEWEAALRSLADTTDTSYMSLSSRLQPYVRWLPSLSFVKYEGSDEMYSLVANRAYKFHSLKLAEDKARDPEHDYLSVVKGIAGALPNMFFYVPAEGTAGTKGPRDFIRRVRALNSEADKLALFRDYGINRNDGRFWRFYDDLHRWIAANEPINGGIIDLAKYDVARTVDTEF